MLILSRKRDEQILIGDGIIITVVDIREGTVRLGNEAPASVTVHRQEVYKALHIGHPAGDWQIQSLKPPDCPAT